MSYPEDERVYPYGFLGLLLARETRDRIKAGDHRSNILHDFVENRLLAFAPASKIVAMGAANVDGDGGPGPKHFNFPCNP